MKRVISVFLSLVMIIGVSVITPTSVNAKSAKSKAIAAYRSYLAANNATIKKFSLIYLDNNNVPELLAFDGSYDVMLFTYKSGKIKNICSCLKSYYWENKIKYYKKTGVLESVNIHYGIVNRGYPKLSGTRLNSTVYYTSELGSKSSSSKVKYYKVNSKGKSVRISKSTFNSKKKELTQGKKVSKAKFYKNTKANRKKYLK